MMAISEFVLQKTDMLGTPRFAIAPVVVSTRIFIQLKPTCLTTAPILGCKAYLIQILKKNAQSQWEQTAINEIALLKWSACEDREISLEPEAERRLNVCYTDSHQSILTPETDFFTTAERLTWCFPVISVLK